jgi:hypothetical protein
MRDVRPTTVGRMASRLTIEKSQCCTDLPKIERKNIAVTQRNHAVVVVGIMDEIRAGSMRVMNSGVKVTLILVSLFSMGEGAIQVQNF